jgi:hypothetical protein
VIDHNNLKYKRNYNLETNLAHQPTFPVGLWHSVLVSVSTGTVIINHDRPRIRGFSFVLPVLYSVFGPLRSPSVLGRVYGMQGRVTRANSIKSSTLKLHCHAQLLRIQIIVS